METDFLARVSEKQRENDFHQRESQLPTSNNELFLSKLCSSYSNNGFYQQGNSTDQKILLPLDRKSVCSSRVKDTFPRYGKAASTLKTLRRIEKNGVHQQEYGSSLKMDLPVISIIVSTYRKKLGIKQQTKQIKTFPICSS